MYLFEKKVLCATARERFLSTGLAMGCEPVRSEAAQRDVGAGHVRD